MSEEKMRKTAKMFGYLERRGKMVSWTFSIKYGIFSLI